jgi:alginate O-acetyltransferase complex protein AlgI
MTDSTAYIKTMFFCGKSGLADSQTMYLLLSYLLLLFVAVFGSLSLCKKITNKYLFAPGTVVRGAAEIVFVLVVWIACVAMLVNSSYNPFLYFRF